MIVSEQGFGDIIQFSRFIPLVKKISRKVILLCPIELVELMKSLEGVDEVIEFNACDQFEEVGENAGDSALPYNYYIRIMSLPHVLGCEKQDLTHINYLKPSQEKIDYWKSKIEDNNKLKIGVCWQGAKRHNDPASMAIERKRSIDISFFEPIFNLENIDAYSLQKDDSFGINKYPNVKNFMPDTKDFSDTAAIIQNLDLIITVDTAIAHLAGVLNKPVWLLSRKSGCWRWTFQGEETVWYPSMKIFRQTQDLCWQPIIDQIIEELKKEVNQHPLLS
jgi:hypothetical protein